MPRSAKARTRAALDGLGDEVGCAADGHEVDGLELADGVDGGGAALGFADHAERPVSASIWRVNLSMRVAVVGPAGPTASSRTASTGPT